MIYIVDDDIRLATALKNMLAGAGYDCDLFADGKSILSAVEEKTPQLVLLDFLLPDRNGVDVLREIRESHPTLPVVMMSGEGTIPVAVESLKLGAYDFLVKPLDANRVKATVRNAIEAGQLQRQVRRLKQELDERYQMIGSSPAMQEVRAVIGKVAATNASVLITGESGVGKELVARAIHAQSPRSVEAFVALNCAAIPETLLESELFGIEKKTASGVEEREGRFEQANGGTVFLDEIGDMGLALQAKILRVLQEQEFERVGGRRSIRVDVRIIAATNKDLSQAISAGKFREDLYYRLDVVPLSVPPLRERQGDIEPLAVFFLDHYCRQHNRALQLAPGCDAALRSHGWPGNIRELRNIIERVVIMAETNPVEPDELRTFLPVTSVDASDSTLKTALDRAERNAVEQALRMTGGNVTEAARMLGTERPSLHRIMRRLGI